VLPPVPDPRIPDAFLARLCVRFEPAPDLPAELAVRYQAAIRAEAPALVAGDAERRAAAARALGEHGAAVAWYLPPILRELRAVAVQRWERAMAAAEAALRAKGTPPEQVQWDPDLAQLEGTVAVLARQLIDEPSAQRQAEAAGLLAQIPEGVWLFGPRAGREILDEPARTALLAAQRRIWATGELPRVFRWLAARNEVAMCVDRDVLAERRESLRDRDYVVPDLVLNNLAGELLCDFMTVSMGGEDPIVVWRRIRPIPDARPKQFAIEFAVEHGDVQLVMQLLVIKCAPVTIAIAPEVDPERPASAYVRAVDATEAVQQVCKQLGLAFEGDAAKGFTIKP